MEANDHNAIDTLLISDKFFRSRDFTLRKIFNELIESVQKSGGTSIKFNSLHSSGERLNNLSGIAAILRFPLNLDYLDEDDDSDSKGETTEEEKDFKEWEGKKELFDEDI